MIVMMMAMTPSLNAVNRSLRIAFQLLPERQMIAERREPFAAGSRRGHDPYRRNI